MCAYVWRRRDRERERERGQRARGMNGTRTLSFCVSLGGLLVLAHTGRCPGAVLSLSGPSPRVVGTHMTQQQGPHSLLCSPAPTCRIATEVCDVASDSPSHGREGPPSIGTNGDQGQTVPRHCNTCRPASWRFDCLDPALGLCFAQCGSAVSVGQAPRKRCPR